MTFTEEEVKTAGALFIVCLAIFVAGVGGVAGGIYGFLTGGSLVLAAFGALVMHMNNQEKAAKKRRKMVQAGLAKKPPPTSSSTQPQTQA